MINEQFEAQAFIYTVLDQVHVHISVECKTET